MKVEYINPFIESVQNVFSTMLGTEARRGVVTATRGDSNPGEMTVLIGMSGVAQGTVALVLSNKTALAMVNHMLGTNSRVMDEIVSDGVAEIVNMVAGRAKSKLIDDGGMPINLSLPSVVRGNNYQIDYPSDAVWLEVPFESDLGDFALRVTFRMAEE